MRVTVTHHSGALELPSTGNLLVTVHMPVTVPAETSFPVFFNRKEPKRDTHNVKLGGSLAEGCVEGDLAAGGNDDETVTARPLHHRHVRDLPQILP